MPSRRSCLVAPVVLLFALGCGGSDGTTVQAITGVSVSPATTTLTSLGATQQLAASARDASGSAVANATFTWSSSATSVATVSAAGVVEAVSNGTATITASVSGGTASGTATITVDQEASAISVTLAADTLTTGGTTQADAEATDAGGSALASPSLSWSSSDETVATVDAAGVVTGVSDGEATIRASQDGVAGTAALVVVRPDLTLAADTMLGGSVVVNELTIPSGTTVTLTSDVTIDAKVAVSIAGTVMGDCVALTVGGEGTVTVSGTLDNACATQSLAGEEAPALVIAAPAGVDLTDATLVSSGPIRVTSEAASPVGTSGRLVASGPARAPLLGTLDLTGATLKAEPAEVPQPTDPASTPSGADITLAGSLDVIVNGTRIQAQHGGPGVPVAETAETPLEVRGGEGGNGGDVAINIAEGGTLRFRTTRGASELSGGDGGPGGPANATTTQNAALDPAPEAAATGGVGGQGGGVSIFGHATLDSGSDLALIRVQVGSGGRGGNATAVGADGVDATDTRDAQVGGDADANAGTGGAAGTVEGGYEGMAVPDGKQGGGGGTARATAGKGGDGNRASPHGGGGGNGSAFGGRSGNSTEEGGRTGGDAIVEGGNGGKGADVCPAFTDTGLSGQISVNSDPASSDPFIFNAGSGIDLGVVLRVLDQLGGPGGNGGLGGDLAAAGGTGGAGRNVRAPDGGASMGAGGNGGDGGAGAPGGSGGSAGGLGLLGDADASRIEPLFAKGATGGSCASLAPGPLLADGDRSIEITGTAPWVDVTGTLAADGTVTASGRGTVAGFSNILTEFSGTWDAETGTLVGTYTIDSEKVISSGHPVVYDVTVSGG